jgi:hypothetical protein
VGKKKVKAYIKTEISRNGDLKFLFLLKGSVSVKDGKKIN